MPTATRPITLLNDVLAPVTLGAAEQQIDFTNPLPSAAIRTVQIMCDVACWYRHASGGSNYPLPANEPFSLRVNIPVESIYLLTQGGGAGTAYILVIE